MNKIESELSARLQREVIVPPIVSMRDNGDVVKVHGDGSVSVYRFRGHIWARISHEPPPKSMGAAGDEEAEASLKWFIDHCDEGCMDLVDHHARTLRTRWLLTPTEPEGCKHEWVSADSDVMAEVPIGTPLRDEWERYKKTDEYQNTRRWALHQEHVDGSLWAAFMAGFNAAQPDHPEAGEVDEATKLSRELRGLDITDPAERAEFIMRTHLHGLVIGDSNRDGVVKVLAEHFESLQQRQGERVPDADRNDAELVANWMADYAERTHSIGAQGLLRKAVTLLNRHVALNRDDAPEPDSGEKQ